MAGIMAGAVKSYGAWYEGEQQRQYYYSQANLTWRQKQEAERKIEMDKRAADFTFAQAEAVDQQGKIAEKNYQTETDRTTSAAFAKTAKSGVDMSYGSPMDYLNDIADSRARELADLSWSNDVNTQTIKEKATIMLDQAKLAESNLPMYDYQADIYVRSGREAEKVGAIKQRGAEMQSTSDGFQRGMSFAG
jgi:hypothetical protein